MSMWLLFVLLTVAIEACSTINDRLGKRVSEFRNSNADAELQVIDHRPCSWSAKPDEVWDERMSFPDIDSAPLIPHDTFPQCLTICLHVLLSALVRECFREVGNGHVQLQRLHNAHIYSNEMP